VVRLFPEPGRDGLGGNPMGSYLLVETRDPFDSAVVGTTYDLVEDLSGHGDDVTLFLAQNGVLAARKASTAGSRIAQVASRAQVLADDFSLRERGIDVGELADGVQAAPIDTVVDLALEDGRKVIWH
jgi:sulfur transfer complex TusBCD TusB component (DsrH family)